jgi:uncharacterized protein (TIRG00374 family)
LISVIAIYAVVRFSKGQEFGTALKSVSIWFILGITALSILSLLVRAIAWRTILGNRVSLKTAFFGISEGYFLNNLFPFRMGEIGRALSVGRSSGLGTFHILSTILIERAFDIVFAAGIILATLPFVVGSDWIKPIAFTAMVVVALGLVLLFLIANNREKFHQWIHDRNFKSKFIQNRILPQLHKITDGMSALAKPSQFFLSVFWIGMTWLIWMSLYYLTIRQLVESAPFWWGAFVASLLALGVAIPAAPASVGVYEAAVVGSLTILGISSSSALAYAIVLHLDQIVITAVFGLWGLIRDGQNLSSLLASLSKKKEQEEAVELINEES